MIWSSTRLALCAEAHHHPPTDPSVEMVELFDQLRRSQVTLSTQDLTTALNWASVAQQQDAHEFMRVLFERIENELKKHDSGDCKMWIKDAMINATMIKQIVEYVLEKKWPFGMTNDEKLVASIMGYSWLLDGL
jgi:hypothetical protein